VFGVGRKETLVNRPRAFGALLAAAGRSRLLRHGRAVPPAALLALSAAAAGAQTFPVTTTFDALLETTFHEVDLATGELTPVGPLGLGESSILAIAWTPSGELLAVDDLARELLSIDPATGQGTVIGSLGIEQQPGDFLIDLAADACGRLWLAVVSPEDEYLLYQVDPDTGAAELRGVLSAPVSGLAAHGETLYALSRLEDQWRIARIDPESATVTPVADIEGLHEFFYISGLDFDDSGDLIALGGVVIPIPVPPLPPVITRFDLGGGYTFGEPVEPPPGLAPPYGLAVTTPPGACPEGSPLPVPAASPLGLVTLAAGLGAAGALVLTLRRRRM
jgi:hypothetical protein